MFLMRYLVLLAVAVVLFEDKAEAGFSCSIAGGFLGLFSSDSSNAGCSTSCVALGQSSGMCGSDGDC